MDRDVEAARAALRQLDQSMVVTLTRPPVRAAGAAVGPLLAAARLTRLVLLGRRRRRSS
jgi:hypothetical protein